MVALGADGSPLTVPPLEFDTVDEKARAERAFERRRHRLETRGTI